MVPILTMKNVITSALFICTLLISVTGQAKSLEPGAVWVGATFGVDSKMGGRLGGSDVLLSIGADVEYALESQVGIYARGNFGLGSSQTIKLETGAKYRFTGLDFPISPYVSAHVRVTHLMNIMGANLWAMGAGAGAGVDYFLTRKFTAGLDVTFDLSSTLGEQPTGYNTSNVVLTARYAF